MYVSERIDRRLKRYESSEPGRVKRTNLAVVKSSTTVLIARLFSLHVSRLFSFTTTTSFPPYFFFLSHCHTVWHLCLVLFHSASGPTLFLLSISTFFFFFLVPWTIIFLLVEYFRRSYDSPFYYWNFSCYYQWFFFFYCWYSSLTFLSISQTSFFNLYFNNCTNNEEISRLIKSLTFPSQLNELLIGVYYM